MRNSPGTIGLIELQPAPDAGTRTASSTVPRTRGRQSELVSPFDPVPLSVAAGFELAGFASEDASLDEDELFRESFR